MDYKSLIEGLDDEIDKLIEKYGTTPDISSINDKWVHLMFCYGTHYQKHVDDVKILEMITEITTDIMHAKQYHERPIHSHVDGLSLRQGIKTGAKAQRYKNAIVLVGDYNELRGIRGVMNDIHDVDGIHVNFTRKGGPRGLMYTQDQGANLYRLRFTDKDYSNSAMGMTLKRKLVENVDDVSNKRIKPATSDFYVENGYIIFTTDIINILRHAIVPFFVKSENPLRIAVQMTYYNVLASLGLMGEVNKSSASDYKLYNYNDKVFVTGKHKYIQELRKTKKSIPVVRALLKDNDDDILIVHNVDKKNFEKVIGKEISMSNEELPSDMNSLLWRLYPNMTPGLAKPIAPLPDVAPVMRSNIPLTGFTIYDKLDDWYNFRGSVKYQYPWALRCATKNVTVHINNIKLGGIYHVAVKRQSKWTRHLKEIFMSTSNSRILIADYFMKDLYNAIEKNRPYITFLVHEFTATLRHANALFIDPRDKTIVRFEPHGSFSNVYDMRLCDERIRDAMSTNDILKDYRYHSPTSFQQKDGPQIREALFQNKYKKVTKMFGTKERVIEEGGFCVAWSILFQHLAVINMTHDPRYVQQELLGSGLTPNDLATTIRVFQSYLVWLANGYYKDI